ncbi:MAG: response regulator transcription factor [Egibacteraceae bacterium]
MNERVKVFLVDDHTLFRAGIRSEIADRVWICGEAADVASAVQGILDTKTVSSGELVAGIRRVAGGDAVFSPRLAGFVLDSFAAIPVVEVDEDLAQLTAREREVLQHVARGYTYKEIGARLYVSVKTVETHVSSVLRKLALTNRHQLSRWAAERNIR